MYVRITLHALLETKSFARQDFGRAIRGRNTNSPNTINYFSRNVLSFYFTSRFRCGLSLSLSPYLSLFTDLYILNHRAVRTVPLVPSTCVNTDTRESSNSALTTTIKHTHSLSLCIHTYMYTYTRTNRHLYACNTRV